MREYDIVDCHIHICHPYLIEDLLYVMDKTGLRRAAALSIPFPGIGTFNAATLAAKACAPDRLYAFCSIDYRNMNEPDFAEKQIGELEKCLAAGADGFKMLLAKPGFPLVHFPLTHPRMRPIYDWFSKKQVPVYLHIGDPIYFWDKTKVYEFATDVQLAGCYADHDIYPTPSELRAETTKLIREYPRVRFILPHLAMATDDLPWLATILNSSAAVMTDISAPFILGAMAHNPRESRDFLEEYADRTLFGTDMILMFGGGGDQWRQGQVKYLRGYREFLETDNTISVQFFPKSFNGIKLSPKTLRKIYHQSFMDFIGNPCPIGDRAALNSILNESIETMNSLSTVPGSLFAVDETWEAGVRSRKATFQNRGATALDDWVFNELRIPEELRARSIEAFEQFMDGKKGR